MKPALAILLCLLCINIYAQPDGLRLPSAPQLLQIDVPDVTEVPVKYIHKINSKADAYQNRLSKKTIKTLIKLSRWENRLQKIIAKADPALAQKLFSNHKVMFTSMLKKVQEGESLVNSKRAAYDEYRDKLTTQFKYLEEKKDAFTADVKGRIDEANTKIAEVNTKANEVAMVDKIMAERKKELTEALMKSLGKNKYLSKISKETWYYRETIKNYKDIFSTPGKVERTAKEVLNKIPAFKEFARKNSMLASLFGTPGNYGTEASLEGLQTRAQIGALINDKLASGSSNARDVFKQNMQQVQAELANLKNKLNKANGKGFSEMPNFKPNTQRTKTFLQRLEYGFNLQFGKGSSFLPASSDIGLSVGYKLNDKSIVGIGASYRMGMGSIQKIRFTHEGLGLRSFLDYKLKKQFYLSGGAEANLQPGLNRIQGLQDVQKWQPSALLGLSRKIPVKTKLSKGTKLQLLYDFLHYRSSARQAWVFRVGYNF